MKTEILSMCMVGRQSAPARHEARQVADSETALAGLMAAVLWQTVKDYLWMLAHGMISEADPFALSAKAADFGMMRQRNGELSPTNGLNTEGRSPGGAKGMRDLMMLLRGEDFERVCECTRFHASRIRAKLSALHARHRAHAEDVRRFIRSAIAGNDAGTLGDGDLAVEDAA